MPTKIKKRENRINVEYSLTSDDIVTLTLLWWVKPENRGVDFDTFNATYMRNVAKSMLQKHGIEILRGKIPEDVIMKKQDLLSATRGHFE